MKVPHSDKCLNYTYKLISIKKFLKTDNYMTRTKC